MFFFAQVLLAAAGEAPEAKGEWVKALKPHVLSELLENDVSVPPHQQQQQRQQQPPQQQQQQLPHQQLQKL